MSRMATRIIAGVLLLFAGIGAGVWHQYTETPELECVPEVQVEYGDTVSVYSLVKRTSAKRGEVTLSFQDAEEGQETEVSFPQTGHYTLTVVAASEAGLCSRASVAVTVVDTTPPELTADAFSVHLGEEIDYLTAVTAVDELDGDLKAQVIVDSSEVDTEQTGSYVVFYQVADAAGNMAEAKSCLTILPKEAETLTISMESCTLEGNGHIQLEATVTPKDWAGTLVWSSSDPNIALVSGGLVTWYGEGTATITVQADGLTAACTVTCEALKPSSVRLNRHTLKLDEGESETLTAVILPSNYVDGTVTWASSNEKVAKVKDGVVTWVGDGSCNIVVTVDGVSDQCAVTCGKKGVIGWLIGNLFG